MQKTDLELQEAVIDAMDAANDLFGDYEDATAVGSFLDVLSAAGYKIVKDTD